MQARLREFVPQNTNHFVMNCPLFDFTRWTSERTTNASSFSLISVNSIAKTSVLQLQKTDIRVNTICPGLIETGMTEATFEYARNRGSEGKIGQLNPLGRFGIAEGGRSSSQYVRKNRSF